MRKIMIGLLGVSFTTVAFANSDQKNYQQFVPKNWKIIETAHGDLNHDGMEDIVLVIEENNRKNVITNDGLGSPKLNTNPRALLVLFKIAQGYQLISKNEKLPSENDADSRCLADPIEDGAVTIAKGILKINLHYWLSCGSWYVTNNTFSFRYQNQSFKLIGFDQMSFHRASGEKSSLSINFSTGKVKEITDKNEFEDSTQPARTEWKNLKKQYDLKLESINFREPPKFQ